MDVKSKYSDGYGHHSCWFEKLTASTWSVTEIQYKTRAKAFLPPADVNVLPRPCS